MRKQNINASVPKDVFFKEREVWWCSIGLSVGFEENGKGELFRRPVLVLKRYGPRIFLGIPLSRTRKKGTFYYPLGLLDGNSTCLLTHVRLFDSRRLTQKMATIEKEDFQNIRKALRDLI